MNDSTCSSSTSPITSHESDHVLNFAYNALCNGTCLDDIELRRNDVVFLDSLRRRPHPQGYRILSSTLE